MTYSKNISKLLKWNAGPSFFYIMSAAFVLLGAAMITIPLYEKTNLKAELFYLVGTIYFYEIVLFLVALLICHWKKGNNDAISLVCLFAIFIVGATITLDTVSVEYPRITLIIGAVSFLAAIGKLFTLFKKVLSGIYLYLLFAIIFILFPNFFMPGILGLALEKQYSNNLLIDLWLSSWWVVIGGCVWLLTILIRSKPDSLKKNNKISFLHNPLMNWIFTFVIVIAVFCHQYTLNFSFALGLKWGDFFPFFVIGVLIALEFKRIYRSHISDNDALWLAIPLILSFIIIGTNSSILIDKGFLGIISRPSLGLIVVGTIIFYRSSHFQASWLKILSALYILSAFFIIDNSFSPAWLLRAMTLLSLIYAIRLRNYNWSIISMIVAATCFTNENFILQTLHQINLPIDYFFALVVGFLVLLAYGFGRNYTPKWIPLIASITLTYGIMGCFVSPHINGTYMPMSASIFAVFVGVCFSIWQKNWYFHTPLLCPLLFQAKYLLHYTKEIIPDNKGWLFIIFSFLFLGLGALFSFAKVKDEDNCDVTEKNDTHLEVSA